MAACQRMVAELIDHIEVHHVEKQDAITNQRVDIHYNCIGAFDVPDRRKIPEADIIMETRKGVALSYAPERLAVWTFRKIKKQSVHYRILRSYKDTLHGPSDWSRTSLTLVPNVAHSRPGDLRNGNYPPEYARPPGLVSLPRPNGQGFAFTKPCYYTACAVRLQGLFAVRGALRRILCTHALHGLVLLMDLVVQLFRAP